MVEGPERLAGEGKDLREKEGKRCASLEMSGDEKVAIPVQKRRPSALILATTIDHLPLFISSLPSRNNDDRSEDQSMSNTTLFSCIVYGY